MVKHEFLNTRVMVYYPTFRVIDGCEDMNYMLDGVEGISKMITGLGYRLPNFLFKFLLELTLGVHKDAPLADIIEG